MKNLRRLLWPLALAPLALVSLTACTGSSTGSGDGDGSDDITVSFSLASSQVVEDTFTHVIRVELNFGHDEDIDLSFFWGGSASEIADYNVTTNLPLTIPAGEQVANLTVQIFEDGKGELDEVVNFFLVKPINASFGPITKHSLVILDEDATLFPEVEPNDDHLTANLVGDIAPELSFEITGSANVNEFDVFELDAIADSTVHLTLDPQSAVAEIVLNILDEDGNTIATFDDDQPGTTISTILGVLAGQKFFLAVTIEVAGAGYVLDVIGT